MSSNYIFYNSRLSQNKDAMQGLSEMKLLLRYCELYGILDKVLFIIVLFCYLFKILIY